MDDTESAPGKSSARKATKQRRHLNRLPTTQIPARLRYGDDVDDDVTAPSRAGPGASQYMNQSIFSMIAAAGSRTDFNKRFDESSDSEGEGTLQEEIEPEEQSVARQDNKSSFRPGRPLLAASGKEGGIDKKKAKRLSGYSLSKPSPKPSLLPSGLRKPVVKVPEPNPESDSSDSVKSNPRDAPVMSRILTAQAEFQAEGGEQDRSSTPVKIHETRSRAESTPATQLAVRIKDIFQLESAEQILAEYQCWLLQSVLLQGYLYITKKHLCFYAFLPKKSNVVSKTGYLSKCGRNNPTYKRSWFTLKGDVLTYYSTASDVYFPQGHIDLRYGISASLTAEKDKQKDCKDFSVETNHRTYYFRADSPSSAKEWVRSLQRTIFRSHNDGDSVKIVLPVQNVIDVEHSPVVEFAETLKVRVIESGDSYAIDEYFFSFFSHGEDVLSVFANLLGKSATRRTSHDIPSHGGSDQGTVFNPRDGSPGRRKSLSGSPRNISPKPSIRESARATLTPYAVMEPGRTSHRKSGEVLGAGQSPTRSSIDSGIPDYGRANSDQRRSSSAARMRTGSMGRGTDTSPFARHKASTDSFVQSSFDDRTDSSTAPISPGADANMSASQILTRSDVFRPPAIKRMDTLQSMSTSEHEKASEFDTAPASAGRIDERRTPVEDMARHASSGRRQHSQVDLAESETSEPKPVRNTPSPALQDIVKAGAYPLSKAGALAGYLKNRSTRMSKALATESMSYLEKVTGMWQGGHKHYGQNEGIVPDDKDVDPEDEEANVGHGDRFRAHFALPETEKLQATYFGYLIRVLPLYGKIYVSNRKFCFRSLLPGTRTKLVLPLKDLENVDKEKGFRFGYAGLVLVIRGHEELFFEFNSADTRDDCTVTLLQSLESVRYMAESGLLQREDEDNEAAAVAEHRLLQEARSNSVDIAPPLETNETIYSHAHNSAVLFDNSKALTSSKPPTSLRVTCLTIGSRGDVQPYIALCKGLLAEGHKPRIATHAEFGPWVIKHGIEFEPIGGDPAELMRICVEHGMFTYSFLREATAHFRSWIDDLLSSSWKACQNSDVLIESPSAMAGIHIAEALGIPYFRAFTMPWTRTRAYPHAFAVPEHKIGGAYNYFSYVMFDNVFWKGIAGQVNRWRKRELGLYSTNLDKMQPNKVPFLYNFSPEVVPPPLDYSDWVRVTGYWFLDEGSGNWSPPAELSNFIAKARADGKKLVYIGFGSIVVSDPAALTKTVVDSVLKADVRCILSKGWSDRLGDPSSTKTEVPLPPEILQIKSAPHDWLFFQVDAAVHHGGAGTTGASLRAGIPTVIKPFFGDQFFFGGRVEDLGVGILLRKVNVSVFARALWEACHSERMKVKAKDLGEAIRKENGVQNAIHAIYRDLDYARTLIKARQVSTQFDQNLTGAAAEAAAGLVDYETEADLEGEESWTFIGDENEVNPDLRRRMSGRGAAHGSRVGLDVLRAGGRPISTASNFESTDRGKRRDVDKGP